MSRSTAKDIAAGHKAINELNDMLKEGTSSHDDIVNKLKESRQALLGVKIHENSVRPFIVAPHQLDTTQPFQFGYGTPECDARVDAFLAKYKKEHPTSKLKHSRHIKDRGHNLSHLGNLNEWVLGQKVVSCTWRNDEDLLLIRPEYSFSGNRRCCFVKTNGHRCVAYAKIPVCKFHFPVVRATPRMHDRFLGAIQNETLRAAYKKHLEDPDRHGVQSEVALMRTMLSAILHRMDVAQDLTNLPIEQIGAVTSLCQRITSTVGEMAQIETKLGMRLTVEQVTHLMLMVAERVISIVEPTQEQCARIAEAIENLPLRRVTAESIKDTSSYGTDVPEGIKNTTTLAKYKEDGSVDLQGFTKEQVIEQSEWVDEKCRPHHERNKAMRAQIQSLIDQNPQNVDPLP